MTVLGRAIYFMNENEAYPDPERDDSQFIETDVPDSEIMMTYIPHTIAVYKHSATR